MANFQVDKCSARLGHFGHGGLASSRLSKRHGPCIQGLGVLELVLDLVVQEGNAVFGLVILFKEVGCLDLQVVKESLGGFLGPFHEVKVVVDIWSVTVYKALGCQLVHGWWRTRGLDHQTLFWSKEGFAAMVLSCPWSVIGEASWTQIVSLFAGAWFDIGGPMMG